MATFVQNWYDSSVCEKAHESENLRKDNSLHHVSQSQGEESTERARLENDTIKCRCEKQCVCVCVGVHLFSSSSTLERTAVRSYSTTIPVSPTDTLGREGFLGLWHSGKCMCLFPGWPFPSVQPEAGSGEPGVPDELPASALFLSPLSSSVCAWRSHTKQLQQEQDREEMCKKKKRSGIG